MNREFKFRAWDNKNKKLIYKVSVFESCAFFNNEHLPVLNGDRNYTIEQFTGLLDKNGNEVYEGDVIQVKKPYRTTQTHTGDNIPNGSYTEPMECAIRIEQFIVVFSEGMFCFEKEDKVDLTPLQWLIAEWDLEQLKDSVCWSDPQKDIFDDPEEGDLNYLLEEYNYDSLESLIKDISGIKIIGNIHENMELI